MICVLCPCLVKYVKKDIKKAAVVFIKNVFLVSYALLGRRLYYTYTLFKDYF